MKYAVVPFAMLLGVLAFAFGQTPGERKRDDAKVELELRKLVRIHLRHILSPQ
jgi:hypothetical protein